MTYDAVVIGAGPAGSVAASLLARAGWSVALVEKAAFPRRKVCGEYLSPTNSPLFAELGIADAIAQAAGPEIRRVGLYARDAALSAEMPRPELGGGDAAPRFWGRALGREVLDVMLRDRAAALGADIHQPWAVAEVRRDGALHRCALSRRGETREIAAPIVIDAHGGGGALGADHAAQPHRPADMLGFKAHFRRARLAADLMPVLVFPGGYGGLVTTDNGRVTFGCCIRRDALDRARAATPGPAGDAVLAYVKHHCDGVALSLGGAVLDGPFLATGPIGPGIRARYADGVFSVGNAAGEVHPLIGEGMSMAMQGAWLLATKLTRSGAIPAGAELDAIGRDYAHAWRRRFAPRIAAGAVFAHLAMRPAMISLCLPVIRRLPVLLTIGAARSGKTRMVVGAAG